jgi:hypothetical protein
MSSHSFVSGSGWLGVLIATRCPREHGHAQGIVVAIGLKMDRKDFG